MRHQSLKRYLEQDPGNVALACELADELIARSAFDDAGSVLESLPQTALALPDVRFRVARCALASGKQDDAIRAYESLLADGHGQMAIEHDLAYALLCARRESSAMEALQNAIGRYGATRELLVLKARIELIQGLYRTSIDSADAALALDANDAAASGIKALALFDDGHPEQAGDIAEATLRRDPDQHEALLVASTLLRWRHEIDAAERLYERILLRHPNSGRALSGYGEIAMLQGDLPRAEELLLAAVEAMPDHIGTWHALAWTQLLQGRRDSAEASYRRAYDIDRNFGDTHGGLSLIAVLRGERENAEHSIRLALRLDANAMTAHCAKALLLESNGDPDGAERMFAELLGKVNTPMNASTRDFMTQLRAMLSTTPRLH